VTVSAPFEVVSLTFPAASLAFLLKPDAAPPRGAADPEAWEAASSGGEAGRRCSDEGMFFLDFGEGVSGTDTSSTSSSMGLGAFSVSFLGVFLSYLAGAPETLLGLEAVLEPEALRGLVGDPVFDPTLGDAFPTVAIMLD